MRIALALVLVLALALLAFLSRDALSPGAAANNAHGTNMEARMPMPAPPAWLSALDDSYVSRIRVPGLEDRAFAPEHWWKIATPLVAERRGFRVEEIGRSVEDRPLRHVVWGAGDRTVLLWSQMHGDESTATMAFADLFRFLGEHHDHPVVRRLRARTTLHFVPLLNPDGAARFERRNAQGIDLNRDARMLATPEARAFKALYDRVRPAFGFNLHDQRVGYRAGASESGVAIALLAPPYNAAREVNAVRARAMEVAAVMRTVLEPHVAGRIARWDDTFNPRAFGDLTTQWGTSTVLMEAGGIEGDLQKQTLRRLNFLALIAALDAISTGSHRGVPTTLYSGLPENATPWPDLLITGGTLALPDRPHARADVLVNFEQPLLERSGRIEDVGDLADTRARRVIDASGLFIVPLARTGVHGSSARPSRIRPGGDALFSLSRDPDGRDVVWTLAGDVDPAHPAPRKAR